MCTNRITYGLLIISISIILTLGSTIHSETVWKLDKQTGVVVANNVSTLGGLSTFPIPYLYDGIKRKVYFFSKAGTIKNIVNIEPNQVARISEDGRIIFLRDDVPIVSCGVTAPTKILDNEGSILYNGTQSVARFDRLFFVQGGNVFFSPGMLDNTTRFNDINMDVIIKYKYKVYSYEYSKVNDLLFCLIADLTTLVDRFGFRGNDNYLACFDSKGDLMWKYTIEGIDFVYSFKLNHDESQIDIFTRDEKDNKVFLTYSLEGKELLRKVVNDEKFYGISKVIDDKLVSFYDGTVTFYNYPDLTKHSEFSTGEYKRKYQGVSWEFMNNGITLTKNFDVILKYFDSKTKRFRLVVFNDKGDLLTEVNNLDTINKWNGNVITYNGSYMIYEEGESVLIKTIH